MKILAIETSCDETACAVVENGRKIIANTVFSSKEMQAKYGGVYPEMAAREQVRAMIPVLEQTLEKYEKPLTTIKALAVTVGPGLVGSLLVGVETAKTMAWVLNKPVVPVDHVKAHIYANWLEKNKQPEFPAICLVVSGGHTELLLMKNHGKFQLLGQTLDDAAGEAFDKTARLLGLSYPGGPAIERTAVNGNPKAFNFPRGMIGSGNYNFSFSGLKTAVLREVNKLKSNPNFSGLPVGDLAASIQEAIVDVLVKKTLKAIKEYQPKSVLLAGGVAANMHLCRKLRKQIKSSQFKIDLYIPPTFLCTDNAACVASFAYFNYQPLSWKKITVNPSFLSLNMIE